MVDGLFAAAFFYAADLLGPFPGKWWILYKEVGWFFWHWRWPAWSDVCALPVNLM